MTTRLVAGLLVLAVLTIGPPPATALIAQRITAVPLATTIAPVGGYGSHTIGGRFGRTVWVTNLNDSGAGSLRSALEDTRSHRIVKFSVTGTVTLQSPIKIKWPYITVAGGSAPGAGIQVRGNAIVVVTHDVILRDLRLRSGDSLLTAIQARDVDSLSINGVGRNVYNVVLDRLSLLWGPDMGGLAILGNVHDMTVQNSIMGAGLYFSRHPEARPGADGHSTAVNVMPYNGSYAPHRITFFRNLFTTSDTRMPRLEAVSCVDLVNNVIYNWGKLAASGNPRSANLINNWFRNGPRSLTGYWWRPQTSTAAPTKFRSSVFTKGNLTDGFGGRRAPDSVVYASSVRCGGLSIHASPASTVLYNVLTNVGARLPTLDSVDRQIIQNLRDRLGKFFNGVDYSPPNPYWPPL